MVLIKSFSFSTDDIPLSSWRFRALHPLLVDAGGLLLFAAACGVLYWNESRAELPQHAASALIVNANAPTPIEEVTFIAATGLITSPQDLADPPYLPPGPF